MRNIYTVLVLISALFMARNSFGQAILWSDDFSDGNFTTNWEWSVIIGQAQIEQNNSNYELKLTGFSPDWTSQIYTQGDLNNLVSADDYTITYTTRMHGASGVGSAIVFKWADDLNYYVVLLSGNGIYILRGLDYITNVANSQIKRDQNIKVKIQSYHEKVKVKVWTGSAEPASWNLQYDSCYTSGALASEIRVIAWWLDDTSSVYFDNFVVFGPAAVDVKETNPLPKEYSLCQNYPNPFNPSTDIRYYLPAKQFVTLKVYDILGNETVVLVNEEKPAGVYNIIWHAANLPSGIYFYKLQADNFIQTKKMILLK
ncbi:MAG: T9SS type A sorting domain-containing protein [Methanococcaceae archaeon]